MREIKNNQENHELLSKLTSSFWKQSDSFPEMSLDELLENKEFIQNAIRRLQQIDDSLNHHIEFDAIPRIINEVSQN